MSNNLDFNFPFPPYEVQQNFMKSLYNIIENKQIGILESPTGTGKTLSLLCGSLKWLEIHEGTKQLEIQQEIAKLKERIKILDDDSKNSKDWMDIQYEIGQLKLKLNNLEEIIKTTQTYEESLLKVKEIQTRKRKEKKFFTRKNNDSLLESTNDIKVDKNDQEDLEEFDLKEESEDIDDEILDNYIKDESPKYSGVQVSNF